MILLILGFFCVFHDTLSVPAIVVDTRTFSDGSEKDDFAVFLNKSNNDYINNCRYDFFKNITHMHRFTSIGMYGLIWTHTRTTYTANYTERIRNLKKTSDDNCDPHYYYVIINQCMPSLGSLNISSINGSYLYKWNDAGDTISVLKKDNEYMSRHLERVPKDTFNKLSVTYTFKKKEKNDAVKYKDEHTYYKRVSSEIKLHTRNLYELDGFIDKFKGDNLDTGRLRFAIVKLEFYKEFEADKAIAYNFDNVFKKIYKKHFRDLKYVLTTQTYKTNSNKYNNPYDYESKHGYVTKYAYKVKKSFSIIFTSPRTQCSEPDKDVENQIPWEISADKSLWCRNTKTMLAFADFYLMYPGRAPRRVTGKFNCEIEAHTDKVIIIFKVGTFKVKVQILSSIIGFKYETWKLDKISSNNDEKSFNKADVPFNSTFFHDDRINLRKNCSQVGGIVIGAMALEYCVDYCDKKKFSVEPKLKENYFDFTDEDDKECEVHTPPRGEIEPLVLPSESEFEDEPKEWTLFELLCILFFLLIVNTLMIRFLFGLYISEEIKVLNRKLKNSRLFRPILYPILKVVDVIVKTSCWRLSKKKVGAALHRFGNTKVGRFLVYQYVAMLPPQPPADPTFTQQVVGALDYVREVTFNAVVYMFEGLIYYVWTRRLCTIAAPLDTPPPKVRAPSRRLRISLPFRRNVPGTVVAIASTSGANTSDANTSDADMSGASTTQPPRPRGPLFLYV